jgi:branched-chain amino acid transport system permease protein
MLTLTYAVIGYYVFGQVATISGFGGITGIGPPSLLDGPVRLYYAGLVLSVLAYVGFVLIRRAPFGVALEGVRDDPIRMASLGFHVPLHRTLAFTLAGLVAATAGVLNIWWNGQIDPNTVSIGSTIDLLVIAVIGGIGRLEGAWLGALVFVAANNYLRDLPFADDLGLTEARFNTVVGLLVLAIVVLSPDGLMGLILQARNRSGSPAGRVRPSAAPPEPTDAGILANSS